VGRAEGGSAFFIDEQSGEAPPNRIGRAKPQRGSAPAFQYYPSQHSREPLHTSIEKLKVSEGEAERSFQDVETSDTGPCETGT
jgi:hypothetical protein